MILPTLAAKWLYPIKDTIPTINPSTAGASPYDYWINTSSTNQDQVYYYAGPTSGWVDSGASLRTNGVFAGVQSLLGPEGAKNG